jgi:haloalkane dehalogenase
MEGVLPPKFSVSSFASMGEEVGDLFKAFRDSIQGQELIIKQNVFIEQTLPCFVNRTLDEKTWGYYRSPFLKEEDRTALWVWPKELPIEGEPAENVELMTNIERFMQHSNHPMLLLYSSPGTLIPPESIPWYQSRINNLSITFVGQGTHFIQEDEPVLIGESISAWLEALNK